MRKLWLFIIALVTLGFLAGAARAATVAADEVIEYRCFLLRPIRTRMISAKQPTKRQMTR